jgi:hypothetical protein
LELVLHIDTVPSLLIDSQYRAARIPFEQLQLGGIHVMCLDHHIADNVAVFRFGKSFRSEFSLPQTSASSI